MEKIGFIEQNDRVNNIVYSDEMIDVLMDDKIDINKFCDLLVNRYSLDISGLSAEQQFSFLRDRSLYILPEQDLLTKLKNSKNEGKPLKVKFGIDPTGSQIHMGHAVPMVLLNRLQRMGHNVVFIIGDFTAKIGDPTGRSSSRPPLTDEQIKNNLLTYKDQVAPFFDMTKSDVLYNGERLKKIQLDGLIKTLSQVSVSGILQRDDFRKRLDNGQGLSMAEILYPIVMGMDSVELQNRGGCDIELGGKDQFLNMQMCRKLMELNGQEAESIISTDILEGISGDGKKMSKSLNNYIALNDTPQDIYGKIMSIPDSLLEIYYKSLTEISNLERNKINNAINQNVINPMEVKKTLAKILIHIIYDKNQAIIAENDFKSKFSEKDYRDLDIKCDVISDNIGLIDYVSLKLNKSKGEIRRLVEGGGISIVGSDNTRIKIGKNDIGASIYQYLDNSKEIIIKVGKKEFLKVKGL